MNDLLSNPTLVFFLIPAIGIILGRLSYKGIGLGVSAVIFVALYFGQQGVVTPGFVTTIGVAFFLFSVGIQAGPSFVATIKSSGFFLFFIASLIVLIASGIALFAVHFMGVEYDMALGIITGALTSTPGLAAATESSSSTQVIVGYSLAYPFGVIGVILFVKFIPRILKIDLNKEAKLFDQESKKDSPALYAKSFLVENKSMDGVRLSDLHLEESLGVNISRIKDEESTIVPSTKSIVKLGNILKVVGTLSSLEKFRFYVGKEVELIKDLKPEYDVKQFVLVNSKYVNKSLKELNLVENFGARVTRIQRNSIEIMPNSKSKLRYGDKLMIAYDKAHFGSLSAIFGTKPNSLSDDFLTLFAGLALGFLLSLPKFELAKGLNFSLGLSGGVILSAILLSMMGKIGNIVWFVSTSTNKVVRELGLIFFFIGVGTQAGAGLSKIDISNSFVYLFTGFLVTSLPMLIVFFILRRFFKTNTLKILGILTGGMTSTPGLASISSATESNAPELFYASIYPFALISLLLAVKIMTLFS